MCTVFIFLKNGSELIGQNATTCEISKNRQYANWDFETGHPPLVNVEKRYISSASTRCIYYNGILKDQNTFKFIAHFLKPINYE